eukprot:GHVT01053307.1.p1 GENE.GHVT01053307.1~~GHVT01053307.1.p1  ORF type:complete len:297 (+),score=41.80 GHVT01053307.1:2-892(+)
MKVVGSGDDPQCLYDSSGMLWDQTSKEFTEKRWPFVVQAKTAVDKLTDLTNGNNHGMQVRVVTPEDENNGGDKAGVYLYNVHWVSEKTGHILFIDKEEIWQQQNNSNLTEDQQEIKALLKQANTMETGKYFHLPDWPSKTFVTKTWRGGQILESATVVSDGLNVGEQVTREELACAIAEAELEAETNIRFPRDNMAAKLEALKPQIYADMFEKVQDRRPQFDLERIPEMISDHGIQNPKLYTPSNVKYSIPKNGKCILVDCGDEDGPFCVSLKDFKQCLLVTHPKSVEAVDVMEMV